MKEPKDARLPVPPGVELPPARVETLRVEPPGATPPGGCAGKLLRSAYYWQGRRTASGAAFDPDGFTAAHRTLPFGTRLTVTNPRTGKAVTVVVNDRGPFTPGLHIDLSRGAAKAIGLRGTGTVCIT
jgi:rare lipoprotein A